MQGTATRNPRGTREKGVRIHFDDDLPKSLPITYTSTRDRDSFNSFIDGRSGRACAV